jgi:hypothetical protein
MSVLPPGENGTTSLTGLEGQVSANAGNAACAKSKAHPTALIKFFEMMISLAVLAKRGKYGESISRIEELEEVGRSDCWHDVSCRDKHQSLDMDATQRGSIMQRYASPTGSFECRMWRQGVHDLNGRSGVDYPSNWIAVLFVRRFLLI